MARDDWVYLNHKKTTHDALVNKLKKDPKMRALGILDFQDFCQYHAQKYLEEDPTSPQLKKES